MPHVPGHTPGTVISSGGTYQPYQPPQSSSSNAAQQLQNIISGKGQTPESATSGIAGQTIKGKDKEGQNVQMVIPANVPKKFHQFLINNQGNSAAQSILDNYAASAVNPYQQQLQNFIESSPAAAQAYAERFPITNFLKNFGPTAVGAVTGLPISLLSGAGKGIKSLSEGEGALAAIAGGIQNVASDIANAFTPQQAKDLQINQEEKSEIPALLKQENIIKGDATPIDPQFAPFLEDSPLGTEGYDLEGDTPSTVYNPETADPQNFDYMAQAMREFDQYKKNIPSNQIAEQVEEETEQTVPGTVNLTQQDDIVLSGDPNEILDTKVDEDEGVVMPSNYAGAYPDPSYLMQEDLSNPLDNQPYINKTFDYDPTVLGGDENIPPGTVFSPNVVGQTPVLPYTFPGLEPKQNAKGGIATLENGGQAGGGKLTAPSMRDLMGVANLMGIAPRTLSTKDAILPMLSESGEFEPDFLSMNQLIFNLARARKPEGTLTTDDIQRAAQDISGPNLSNRDDSGYARMSTFEKLKMMADSD